MNLYKFTCNNKIYKFAATDLEDAYEKAGRNLINTFDSEISNDSCDLLDMASRDNWIDVITCVKQDGLNLSDIQEIDNEE